MKPIIIALDYAQAEQALELVDQLDPQLCALKIGKELFTRAGPSLVDQLVNQGYKVFLDLKFYDIPNTVASACAAAADLGVWMINVHASGGLRMMAAARERLATYAQPPKLIAVTVLTSMSQEDLAQLGINTPIEQQVSRLAALAQQAGLDGVVCSPLEAARLRQERGTDFLLVTPGVRPAQAEHHDQKRVLTPQQALAAGANYLVIGRPITQAPDPLAALKAIAEAL